MMSKLPFVVCAALVWICCPGELHAKCKVGEQLSPGDHTYQINFDAYAYSFALHVPPGYDGKTPVPLVFDLHGYGGDGPGEFLLSGWTDIADMYGFLAVAPTGYMNSWNGDIAFGAAYEAKVDHVGLMRAIVEQIAGLANIDRTKVYSTGLSNGAAMSNTLGCRATDTFAGIAPVADPLDIELPTCMPAQPTSVLGFHGYDDEAVPYDGGTGNGPKSDPFPSIPDTLKAWAKIMSCTGTPELIPIQGRNKCEIYRTCKDGTEVGYCSLEAPHLTYQQAVLNISDYAWKFFEKHALLLPDADGDKIADIDDNCPSVANADQADANANCVGDVCECALSADCDDGKYCNGEEICTKGVCMPGAGPCASDEACNENAAHCSGPPPASSSASAPAASGAAGAAGAAGLVAGSSGQADGSSTGGSQAASMTNSAASASNANSGRERGGISAAGTGGSTGSPIVGGAMPAESAQSRGGGCSTNARAGEAGNMSNLLLLTIAALFARRRNRLRIANGISLASARQGRGVD